MIEPVVVTRIGSTVVTPATPRPPMPLPLTAEIRPATNVPCPTRSGAVAWPKAMSFAGPTRPARSGWVSSTPLLTTATRTGEPPPATASASPAPTASYAQSNGRPVLWSTIVDGSASSVRVRVGSIQRIRASDPSSRRTASASTPGTTSALMRGEHAARQPGPREGARHPGRVARRPARRPPSPPRPRRRAERARGKDRGDREGHDDPEAGQGRDTAKTPGHQRHDTTERTHRHWPNGRSVGFAFPRR